MMLPEAKYCTWKSSQKGSWYNVVWYTWSFIGNTDESDLPQRDIQMKMIREKHKHTQTNTHRIDLARVCLCPSNLLLQTANLVCFGSLGDPSRLSDLLQRKNSCHLSKIRFFYFHCDLVDSIHNEPWWQELLWFVLDNLVSLIARSWLKEVKITMKSDRNSCNRTISWMNRCLFLPGVPTL